MQDIYETPPQSPRGEQKCPDAPKKRPLIPSIQDAIKFVMLNEPQNKNVVK